MAGLETAINLLSDIHFNTTMFGQNWLMYITIIFATLMIITRKWSDWGTLLLPVLVGWEYFGMPIPTTFFIVGTIIFVVDIMSLKVITGAFEGIVTTGKLIRSKRFRQEAQLSRAKWQNRRIDIKEEMERLKLAKSDHKNKIEEMKLNKLMENIRRKQTKKNFEHDLKYQEAMEKERLEKERFELETLQDKNTIINRRREADIQQLKQAVQQPSFEMRESTKERLFGIKPKKKRVWNPETFRMEWK